MNVCLFKIGDVIQVQSRFDGIETGTIIWIGKDSCGNVIYNTSPNIAVADESKSTDYDITLRDIIGTPENQEFYS